MVCSFASNTTTTSGTLSGILPAKSPEECCAACAQSRLCTAAVLENGQCALRYRTSAGDTSTWPGAWLIAPHGRESCQTVKDTRAVNKYNTVEFAWPYAADAWQCCDLCNADSRCTQATYYQDDCTMANSTDPQWSEYQEGAVYVQPSQSALNPQQSVRVVPIWGRAENLSAPNKTENVADLSLCADQCLEDEECALATLAAADEGYTCSLYAKDAQEPVILKGFSPDSSTIFPVRS